MTAVMFGSTTLRFNFTPVPSANSRGSLTSRKNIKDISIAAFYQAVQSFRPLPDSYQRRAINAPRNAPLFIVAGPGSGKTTVIALRILKLIIVDKTPPRAVLATTFTNKAAMELRSRILGWGYTIIQNLADRPSTGNPQKEWLRGLDINQVITGTLDSICDELLRQYREPGT